MLSLSLQRPARIVAMLTATMVALLASLAATASAAVINPDLKPACGAKVILVLDESGSIQGTAGAEAAVRNAANALATGLADTGSQLAVIEFGSSAKRVFNYTPVTSGATGTLVTTFQPYFGGTAIAPADVYDSPSQTGQFTNWEDALQEVQALNTTAGVAPLVVFITDGDPTATGTSLPFQTNVAIATALAPAVIQADAVKTQGSHILAVGVGAALNNATSLGRLSAISGPDVVTSATAIDLKTTDVLAIANFANLPTALATIVNELCVKSVTITKVVNRPVVVSGTLVTYTIRVTNTGGVALNTVTVADAIAPSCAKTIGGLAVGAFNEYTCTATITQDTTNTATVTSKDPQGAAVAPKSASATVDVIAPKLTIAKSVDKPVVLANTPVTYTIRVTNTGDATITGITVGDALTPSCAQAVGTLAPGAVFEYTCPATITQDTTNVATASGTDQLNNPVTAAPAQAFVDVIAPGLDITKTVDKAQVTIGQQVTYTITVRNSGDVILTNVVVKDPTVPACDKVIGDLAVGATVTVTCTATVTANNTNVAIATATDPVGNPGTQITRQATAAVTAVQPINIAGASQTTLGIDKRGPATAKAGQSISYRIKITNTGTIAAQNVVVRDRLPTSMALAAKPAGVQLVNGFVIATVGTLDPGASKSIILKVRIDRTATGARTNVATASATNAAQVRDSARIRIVKIGGRVRIPIVTG